ncbi:MAG: stage II sporulation protein M [Telluria sp.]
MKQVQFERAHAPLWDALEASLAARPRPPELPAQYRRLCQALALAEQRGYSPALTAYLRSLALRCHRALYGASAERPAAFVALLAALPRSVRAEWRLVGLVTLLFVAAALAVGLAVWFDPQHATLFESADQLRRFHTMYAPGRVRVGRENGGDVAMFGFYVWNNVSIGFRTFAAGIFGGVPALLSVFLNAVSLGTVAAWLSLDSGTRATFWPFVITHSSFEVTGLLLSATAGLRLGWSLLSPGRHTRRESLRLAASAAFPLMIGAAVLTVVAAFFEAFWSANPALPPEVRVGVGAACWTLLLAYLLLAGRRRDAD